MLQRNVGELFLEDLCCNSSPKATTGENIGFIGAPAEELPDIICHRSTLFCNYLEERMETPQYTPAPEEPKKSNTTLIIAIVAAVVLCCCCIGIGLAWQYGDVILQNLQIQ